MNMEEAPPNPKPRSKEAAKYHNAMFVALSFLLRKYRENGDITLTDEHQLSKYPLKIDIMVVKKNRDVAIETSWGRIFRQYNVIEYKSPSDRALSPHVFNKVVYGYVGIYASQENVCLTEMSATIVCFRKPVKLFKHLKEKLNYEILREDKGVYYIIQKGSIPEKSLAVQIVVSSELPQESDEFLLSALRPGISVETARKIVEMPHETKEDLKQWVSTVSRENEDIFQELYKEEDMKKGEKMIKFWEEEGVLESRYEARRQEGMQKGMQKALALIEKGYSVEEAKKKLQRA
jgi:hypothetical protein